MSVTSLMKVSITPERRFILKRFLISSSLILAAFVVTYFHAGESEAASWDVVLTYEFAGCSGNTATYNLTATTPGLVGGAFTWGSGITPISGRTADPNYATVSFFTWQKIARVDFVHPFGIWSDDMAFLSNPCISI